MDPHRLAEARSLALHIEILSRLEQDPSLLSQVRARLSEWQRDPSKPRPYVERWIQLVDGPLELLRATMTGDDEHARALRQATPFAGIVDPRTRWRIWTEVRGQLEGAR